jgi:hypothetical protein
MNEALQDRDDGVRREAMKALGDVKDYRTVEPLIGCLDDEAFIIKREAAETLTKITGRNIGLVSDRWRAWWVQNRREVETGGRSISDGPLMAVPPQALISPRVVIKSLTISGSYSPCTRVMIESAK